jgi:hypothetical protein
VPARAIDVQTDVAIGYDFVYAASDIESELLDGQLALGAGLTMVSDYAIERYGAQALVEYRGDHVDAGVGAGFAPRQESRGWASVDPHAALHWSLGRATLRAAGGVLLRRVDAAVRRATVSVDQLQLHGDVELNWNGRWKVSVAALGSFYDPDPASGRLRGADLGLAVSLAGRPERWAVGGEGARRVVERVWIAAGASAVTYADGSGTAAVPRVAVDLGPWRDVSIGASLELVVDPGRRDAVHEIGGVSVEYER